MAPQFGANEASDLHISNGPQSPVDEVGDEVHGNLELSKALSASSEPTIFLQAPIDLSCLLQDCSGQRVFWINEHDKPSILPNDEGQARPLATGALPSRLLRRLVVRSDFNVLSYG
jgi:hypothetical protein